MTPHRPRRTVMPMELMAGWRASVTRAEAHKAREAAQENTEICRVFISLREVADHEDCPDQTPRPITRMVATILKRLNSIPMRPIAPNIKISPVATGMRVRMIFWSSEKNTHRYNNYYQSENDIAREIIDKGFTDDTSEATLGDKMHSFGSLYLCRKGPQFSSVSGVSVSVSTLSFSLRTKRVIQFSEADSGEIVHRKRHRFFLKHIERRV